MIVFRCSRDSLKCDDCPILEECNHIEITEDIDPYFLYEKGRTDQKEEVKRQMISLHTDMIFRYGADIVEARCDAFDELEKLVKGAEKYE